MHVREEPMLTGYTAAVNVEPFSPNPFDIRKRHSLPDYFHRLFDIEKNVNEVLNPKTTEDLYKECLEKVSMNRRAEGECKIIK
jgi:hypothetical protein